MIIFLFTLDDFLIQTFYQKCHRKHVQNIHGFVQKTFGAKELALVGKHLKKFTFVGVFSEMRALETT